MASPRVDRFRAEQRLRQNPPEQRWITGVGAPEEPVGMLSAPKAAARLGISIDTLRDWRSQGKGPHWVRYDACGPVYYDPAEIESFIRESAHRYGGPR